MQSLLIPVTEVMQLLGIHSRIKWYKKLEQHDIQIIKDENLEYLQIEDAQFLQQLQQQYETFSNVIKQCDPSLTVAEQTRAVKFLRLVGLLVRSEDLPFTDQIRVDFSRAPHLETLQAVALYRSLGGPETEQGVTVQQLARRLHIQLDDIACDLYHGRVADDNLIRIGKFQYFTLEYAERCEFYYKTWVSLDATLSDKPYPPEQIVRKLQRTCTCEYLDTYYIGSKPGWYGLRREREKVKKVIDECVRAVALEQGDFPKTIFDGIAYMEADICVKQLNFPTGGSLENKQLYRAWQAFLYKNEKQLKLRKQNQALYLPVERTEMQNTMLTLFFELYGRSEEEVHACMIKKLKVQMPVALSLLEEKNANLKIQNGVMVQLYLHAKHDLPDCSQKEIDHITKAFQTAPLVDGECFSWMLEQAYQRYSCRFRNLPKFKHSVRSKVSHVKQAYSMEQYATMAYCLFHSKYIKQQDMIQKACKNAMMAEAWLYLSLHWICALRSSDLQKIPILPLPEDAETLLQQIRTNSLSDTFYERIIDKLEFQIRMHPWKPQKTHKYNVPDVKIFFPQSLKVQFGIMYLLVLIHRELEHRQNKELFRLPQTELLLKFLGKRFVDQLEKGRFSSRSANKAFLQGIQTHAEQDPSIRMTGYMMASLARSHKGSENELAPITEVYLRDANFTGQTAEYFAKIMFDRGVLSFIPDLLLKIVYGPSYENLLPIDQTQFIQSVDVSPSQIEDLLITNVQAMQQARQDVMELLKKQSQSEIMEGLLRIAQGQAASKNDYSYCLCRALGQKCDHVTCISCPYEIQTRTGIYMLTQQYRYMMKQYREADQTNKIREAARYRKMIEHIIPVLASAASYLQQKNPESSLLVWMKEEIKSC